MEFISDHKTLKSLRDISTQDREAARKLAELHARAILEPGTGNLRGILEEMAMNRAEDARILDALIEALAAKDGAMIEKIMGTYSTGAFR